MDISNIIPRNNFMTKMDKKLFCFIIGLILVNITLADENMSNDSTLTNASNETSTFSISGVSVIFPPAFERIPKGQLLSNYKKIKGVIDYG